MATIHQAVGVLTLISCVACFRDPVRGTAQSDNTLVAQLRSVVTRERPALPFDSSAVTLDSIASTVVPGLTYAWAQYRDAALPHFPITVAGMRRSGRFAIASEPDAWSRTVGDWKPRTHDEAVAACREAAAVIANSDPQRVGFLESWSVDSLRQVYFPADWSALARAIREAPVTTAEAGGSTLSTTFWYFDLYRAANPRRIAVRYQCRISNGASTGQLTIMAQDSIIGIGHRR